MSSFLCRAIPLLLLVASPAFAELNVDVIGSSEIAVEALIQGDTDRFSDDFAFSRLDGQALSTAQTASLSSAYGDLVPDSNLRRAEFVLKGKGPTYDWQIGYDMSASSGRGKWLDVYYRRRVNADWTARVGQYKQPNSLEELTSTRNNDFISKALTTNAFGVARRLGAELAGTGALWTLTGSAFARELSTGLAVGNGAGVRGTYTPMADEINTVHLGLSGIVMDTQGDRTRLRVRPDADLANLRLVDSGDLVDATSLHTLGAEAAWLHGPLKLTGEYMRQTIQRDATANFNSDSWYASGIYNLTGENFTYKQGIYSTPLPNQPSRGMWQAALRYDTINLDDGMVNGGKEDNLTVGVNWYWRQNVKLMANYVKVNSDRVVRLSGVPSAIAVSNDPDIIEMRVQIML